MRASAAAGHQFYSAPPPVMSAKQHSAPPVIIGDATSVHQQSLVFSEGRLPVISEAAPPVISEATSVRRTTFDVLG